MRIAACFCVALLGILTCGACGGSGGPGQQQVPPDDSKNLSQAGGTLDFGAVKVSAGAGDLRGPVSFLVQEQVVGPPGALPPGHVGIGQPVDLAVLQGAENIAAAPSVEWSYDASGMNGTERIVVLHYDEAAQTHEPVTMLAQVPGQDAVRFLARSFSTFTLATLDDIALATVPADYTVPGFDPQLNGWSIANAPAFFAMPGGASLGMAAYAAWFHRNKQAESLATKYDAQAARLVAIRAHLALYRDWAKMHDTFLEENPDPAYVKYVLSEFEEPLVLVMRRESGGIGFGGQAVVIVGYDDTNFYVYDVNDELADRALRSVPYDAGGWLPYESFNSFALHHLASMGEDDQFEILYQDAESGFGAGSVEVTSHAEGATVLERYAIIRGTCSVPDWDKASVFVNGVPYDTTIVNGAFQLTAVLFAGTNHISVLCGTGDTLDGVWFAGAGATGLTVHGDFPVADLVAVLTWDRPDVDIDLTVRAPDGTVSTPRVGIPFGTHFGSTSGIGSEIFVLTDAAGDDIQSGSYEITADLHAGEAPQVYATLQTFVQQTVVPPITRGFGGIGPQGVPEACFARVDPQNTDGCLTINAPDHSFRDWFQYTFSTSGGATINNAGKSYANGSQSYDATGLLFLNPWWTSPRLLTVWARKALDLTGISLIRFQYRNNYYIGGRGTGPVTIWLDDRKLDEWALTGASGTWYQKEYDVRGLGHTDSVLEWRVEAADVGVTIDMLELCIGRPLWELMDCP